MSTNLFKILPLNDAPSAIRNDLILNAFVGAKNDMLGFVTGKRVADAAKELVAERDELQTQLGRARARIDRLEGRIPKDETEASEQATGEVAAEDASGPEGEPVLPGIEQLREFHGKMFEGVDADAVTTALADSMPPIAPKELTNFDTFLAKLKENTDQAKAVAASTVSVLQAKVQQNG